VRKLTGGRASGKKITDAVMHRTVDRRLISWCHKAEAEAQEKFAIRNPLGFSGKRNAIQNGILPEVVESPN